MFVTLETVIDIAFVDEHLSRLIFFMTSILVIRIGAFFSFEYHLVPCHVTEAINHAQRCLDARPLFIYYI